MASTDALTSPELAAAADVSLWQAPGRMTEADASAYLVEAAVRALPAVAFAAVVLHARESDADLSWALLRGTPLKGTSLRALTADLEAAAPNLGSRIEPEATQRLAQRLGLGALAAVPLDAVDRRLGYLLVGREAIGLFTPSEEATLAALGRHATLVLDNVLLRRQAARAERRRREVDALFDIVREITSRLDLEAVFSSVVRHAKDLIGTKLAYLALLDEERHDFHVRATVGERTDRLTAVRMSMEEGVGAIAARERAPVSVPDIVNDPRRYVEWEDVCAAEGIRAVLVAPLCVENRLLGMLFVANRHVTEFTSEDAAALGGLADIAAVAIENTRLYENEREAAARLQRLSQAHATQYAAAQRRAALYDVLIEAALSMEGLQAVATALARLLQNPVVVEDRFFRPLASAAPNGDGGAGSTWQGSMAHPRQDPELSEALRWMRQFRKPIRVPARPDLGVSAPRAVAPVVVGGAVAGYLSVLEVSRSLDQPDFQALEQAVLIVALELRRMEHVTRAERRFGGELLHELLDSGRLADTADRARRLGYDPDILYTVALIAIDEAPGQARTAYLGEAPRARSERLLSTVDDALRAHCADHAAPLTAVRDDHVVVLWPLPCAADLWRSLHLNLTTLLPDMHITVAVGEPTRGIASVAAAYRGAQRIMRAATRLGRRGQVVQVRDLGIYRLLVGLDAQEDLLAFAREALGPLIAYDTRRNGGLLRTLDAYLEHACHVHATAKALVVHPHTLRYRILRIQELLGRRLDDPAWRREAHIALVILHVEEPTLFG